jgi:hypothetical protein
MSISFAATPQSKEAQQARTYTDPSAGAPPSRRSGYNAPYVDLGHWNKVFTDQNYFDSIAKQKGMTEGAKVSLHGDDYVYRQAMIGYLADTRKVPLDDMRSIFDAEKDGFAKTVLGKQTASAREMFDWQKGQFERSNEKKAAADQILQGVIRRSLEDALSGGDTPFVESVGKDIDAAAEMFDDEEKSRLWEKAEELDMKIRASQAKFAPEARFIFDALQQSTGQKTGFGAPDMREMASRFAQLPDNQRKAIYELAGGFAQITQTNKGFWYQMAESLGRGASDIVERVPRNFREQTLRGQLRLLNSDQPVFRATGVAGAEFSAAGSTPVFGATQGQMLTPEEREEAKAKIQSDLGVLKVERELRDLAERVVDPIKTIGVLPEIIEEGLYGAARSIPYTAVAAVPIAGVPAVASALFSSNYDRIMLEYPDLDPDKAALIAAISAPIEAGLERMKVNTITGRLPVFGGLVKRLQHPNQRNITRIAIGGAGIVAEQNVQEIVQNATFPFVQTIAAALDADMPDYDWEERLAGMPRELAVQFVALLPLSLMGVGALSYREISRGENYLKSKADLEKAGYNEEQIDRITGAESAEAAQAALVEEHAKRDPKLVKAAAQRIVDESIALREKANPAALPRLEKQGADYVVLSPEGKELARTTDQTAAEQALVSARRETVQREMRDVHTGINEAVAFIQKVNEARQRGEDIAEVIREEAPRTLLTDYEANPTQENLDRLFETVRAFGQDINEPAELANFPVTGSNQGALREGIWRSIIRINEGADGTIVMREFAQDNLKRAISEGRTTMDFVRQQLNDILPQIDSDRIQRRLRTETDTDVIEAFSDVALAYFRGQIREEQIPAGLRGIMRRLAIFTRDIFRRAYNLARLRAEGKLDRDFEALLAEAVGVDQQALVDRSREKTAQEVAPEMANYSIGVTSQQDADYLAAVERGDMETAQRIVDEAAQQAGDIRLIQAIAGDIEEVLGEGTNAESIAVIKQTIDDVLRFLNAPQIVASINTDDKTSASGEVFSVYEESTTDDRAERVTPRSSIAFNNYLLRFPPHDVSKVLDSWATDIGTLEGGGLRGLVAHEMAHVVHNYLRTGRTDEAKEKLWSAIKELSQGPAVSQYASTSPSEFLAEQFASEFLNQTIGPATRLFLDELQAAPPVKSSAPVTRDSQGNVIPLSQRFDATTADINYSIVRSVDHYRNDTRFDKLVKDGRVFTGVDVNDFTDMHILLHSPDNAFAGTIQLTDGGEIKGKGGVYYPALYADKNYFWASTEAMVMRTANHLNEIGAKNGGRILMGLVSAPVEKLFSSTSMATGVVKFLNALTTDSKAGLLKSELNAMLVAASKVEVIVPTKTKETKKTFRTKLKASDSYATNFAKIDALLEPTGSIFQVRKAFVESLAEQIAKHLNAKPESAKYVAGILANAENKHAKNTIKRGTLSKASVLQGLGNMLTEPFLRDFQEHGSGKIYAIVEVQGEVKGIATTEHESYPATIVPVDKKSKVKLHVLKEAVDWQDVVGKETGQYATPQERLNLLPTSGMSSTSLKVLGVKAGSSANLLNYSISTQREIDRVQAAMDRLARSPLDSLGYTEKIRERFAQIMAENMAELQAMQQGGVAERTVLDEEGNPIGPQPDAAKTKATGAEMRRTKFLQALGELDGLLSVLPPQVAAKVGGYTVLTNIGTGDRALSNFFIKRLEMIDKELERYLKDRYTTALKELFKRAKPKRDDAGKVPKGKLGGGVHTLFERLEEAVEMSSVEIDGEIASLEQQIASGELEPEQEAASILLSDSLPLFGEWKTADASRMAQAVQMGYDIYRIAYKKQQAKALLRKNVRDQERIDGKEASGAPDDTAPVRQQNKNEAEQLKSKTKGIVTNLLSFDQLMSLVFGRDSAFTKKWVNWQRKSDNAKDDEFNAVYDQWSKFLATLTKHEKPYSMKATYAGQDLAFSIGEPKHKIKHTNVFGEKVEFEFSQADLLDITMMWMQPKGRAHMIGRLDDYGDPISDWSYDQTFVNKAEALLTDEAKAIRDFLLNDYAEQWSELNEVFVKLNDINLPQEQFYSPLSVNPVQTTQNQTVDPLTGFAVAVPNRTPPSLRSRGAAVAEPVFSNAINKWFAHRLQMAHWKAYAEFNNEALSVLGHRNVRNAIEAKVGQAGLTSLQHYLTYFQQGGNRAADANLELTKALRGILGRAITMSLFGRIGTVLIQFTQLGAAAAKMPLHAYLRRFSKLMTGQMGWGEALKSPYIQRRIAQMPPQVQVGMAGLQANKPSQIREAARRVGWLLSGNDGLSTAGTYAMVYDYQLEQMKKAGMTGAQAEAAAREEAERTTDEIAQPTRAGARSSFELSQTSPLQTVAWAFASEPRKNVALLAYLQRAKRPLSEKSRAMLYVFIINGVFAALMRTMLRDLRDDEDDEIFDWDDTWNPKRLALMVMTEPLYGVPVLGEMAEEAIFRAFREYRPEGSLYSVADPAFSLSRVPEHFSNLLEGEVDGRRLVKDINNILRGFGYAFPTAAGAAALSNLGKEVYEMADTLFGDDE